MTANSQSESTALSVAVHAPAPTGRDLILQTDNLNAIVRVAELMANSKQMVPKHLRGNPGGCMAVTMQAMRWNMDPFALAVKTYTVDAEGPVAYEGQAIIAALNNSPLLATRLSFTWEGQWERIVGRFKEVESKKKDANGNPLLDAKGQPKKYIVPAWDFNTDEEGLKVIVSAYLVGEAEPRVLELMLKQARTRNSPLWTEDPKQQLAYLAGRRWGRLHAPDVIMGVYTPDELAEGETKFMGPVDEVQTAAPPPAPAAPAAWTDADLAKRESKIAEFYGKGKTADEIIAFYSSKAALSEAHQKRIRDLKPAAAAAEQQAQDVTPKVTYAVVASAIAAAQDHDQLDAAKAQIPGVADEGQRKELTDLAAKRGDELAF